RAVDDEVRKDMEQLIRETWVATEGVSDGKPLTKEQIQRCRISFCLGDNTPLGRPDRIILYHPAHDGKTPLVYTYRIDPTKSPKQISGDRLEGGMLVGYFGIYHLEEDTLKLCWTFSLSNKWPNAFTSPRRSGYLLLTLKRAKK